MRYLIILLIAMMSCIPGRKIFIEKEIDIDLSQFNYYQWSYSGGIDSLANYFPNLHRSQLQTLVDLHMEAKGYRLSTVQSQVELHFHVIVSDRTILSTPTYNYERKEVWFCSESDGLRYKKGTLLLDVVDIQTGNLIWRSRYVGWYKNKSRPINERTLTAAVTKMLKSLPVCRHPSLSVPPTIVVN